MLLPIAGREPAVVIVHSASLGRFFSAQCARATHLTVRGCSFLVARVFILKKFKGIVASCLFSVTVTDSRLRMTASKRKRHPPDIYRV